MRVGYVLFPKIFIPCKNVMTPGIFRADSRADDPLLHLFSIDVQKDKIVCLRRDSVFRV